MTPHWLALAREAEVTAELLATGVTALGRAAPKQTGHYIQAFFALSQGFERAAKLAIVVDHSLENSGLFPTDDTLRARGHDLQVLLAWANQISLKYRAGLEHSELPDSAIHTGIIHVLTEFAKYSRYYNLDYLAGRAKQSVEDPVATWFGCVGSPILEKHYTQRRREWDAERASALREAIGGFTMLRIHTEEGHLLEDVGEVALLSARSRVLQKYSRLYVLQIVRFFACIMSVFGDEALRRGIGDIPYLSDFFGMFYNEDAVFLRRKTWSIYRP